MIGFISQIISSLLSVVERLGYIGIFIGMTIESSVFPLPSELMLIPAGALISQGRMSFLEVFIFGLLGSIFGSAISYFLALILGRKAVEHLASKYGKVILLSKEEMDKTDKYYKNHGEITTFVGRLLPGVRHLISLPAGFAKMKFPRFIFFTSLGAGLWSLVLIYTGWLADRNQNWLAQHPILLTIIIIFVSLIIVFSYILFVKKKEKKSRSKQMN